MTTIGFLLCCLLIRRGDLPPYTTGKRVFPRVSDVGAWAMSRLPESLDKLADLVVEDLCNDCS